MALPQNTGRQRYELKDEKARRQGIKDVVSSLKSACIEDVQRDQKQTVSKDRNTQPTQLPLSTRSSTPGNEKPSASVQDKDRKRKRTEEPEETTVCMLTKRSREFRQASTVVATVENTLNQEETGDGNDTNPNPIDYWRETGSWPERYFEQDDQARQDFKNDFEKDSWYEKCWAPEINMNNILARKRSSLSSARSRLSDTPSDQKPREVKSAPYQGGRYPTLLATKGIFMSKSKLGITNKSKTLCQTLLEREQTVPQGPSLFHDDALENACPKMQNRNEARVIQDITRLIVPSAETLATLGAIHLENLVESVNEGWNNSIPITKSRPQPDYTVGFGREAFTEDQLRRLEPFVGDLTDTSFFMATFYMYFPFLTCEVKCSATGLVIADRQNAHSATMAVRGIVELFRLVKREQELHREILAFSVSHDHQNVRIYGHYPIVERDKTTFYQHPIHTFDITALDGREKWTTYKFTKNVYDIWMPAHLERICSVIDELPLDLSFEVSQLGESGLSQGIESDHLSDPPSHVSQRDITPDTSLSQNLEQTAFKRPKKRERPAELHQS